MDDWEVATWSGARLVPAATKQHPSLIFHSPAYVQAVSSPIAAPIVASLFMRSPICYQLNGPTGDHQVGHGDMDRSTAWKFVCSKLLLAG